MSFHSDLLDYYVERYNAGDLDTVMDLYADDAVQLMPDGFFEGTHTGALPLPDGSEVPPTGKRLKIRGMELVQMRDGKIVVDNLYYDNMALLAQLGLIPEGAIA